MLQFIMSGKCIISSKIINKKHQMFWNKDIKMLICFVLSESCAIFQFFQSYMMKRNLKCFVSAC